MAAATYFDTVQKIYIAFYQRPADPAGLKYWAEQIDLAGGDASAVVAAFATSAEATALYGTIDASTIGNVIDAIYMALFNRLPDAAGKQFYVDGFTAGTFTAGSIALAVLDGATGGDATAIANKAAVANEFTAQVDGRPLTDAAFGTAPFAATYAGDTDAGAARGILATVTEDAGTILTPTQVTQQIQVQIADAGDAIITFSLIASASSVNEGASVTFNVVGGQANFTYSYDLTGVDATDVTGGALTGTITTDANGKGSFTVALANDRVSDGVDTLVVTLPNTGKSASVTVNDTSTDNIAPVAVDATGATTEAGAVVTGQLVATDAENDAVTFALDAAVEGLTLNADGTYSFDPSLNTAAQALTYKDAALDVVANYTVTDALGATDTGTITITVTPKPLTFTLTADKTSAEEGATTVYTVTASEAVIDPVDVVFTLQPGNGTAVNTGTDTTNTSDFATGAFNPTTKTIAAGATTATFDVVAVNDANTELQESYTVKAEVAGQATPLTLAGKVVDATGTGGLGQTFTLTSGIDTIPGLIGSANSAGTDGDDIIVTTQANLGALDSIDAGLGANVLRIEDTAAITGIAATNVVKNVQTINMRSAGAVTMDLTASTNVSGVTALNSNLSAAATLTAAATTDIGVSGATGAIKVEGGKNVTVTDATAGNNIDIGAATVNAGTVTVTDTSQGAGTIIIDGGTAVTVTASNAAAAGGVITVGQGGAATDLPSGAVAITSKHTGTAATDVTMGKITVTGGSTVTVTQTADASKAAADTTGATLTQGAVVVTAGKTTTSVTVNQAASQAKVVAVAAVAGVTETASVKFSALASGKTVIIGGDGDATLEAGELAFTAAKDLTAAEVAQAFANLINPDTQASGVVANGVYTLSGANSPLTTWTSGAANGDTVVFTSTTANNGVTDFAVNSNDVAIAAPTLTQGSKATAAVTGKLGVITGAVTIEDNATAASIKTITLDGYDATGIGATNNVTKLETLNLANSGGAAAGATNAAVTANVGATLATLNLGLNNVQGAVTLTGAGLKTVAVTTSGANSTTALSAAAAETLTVAGDKAASFTADLAALKAVTVSGSAGLTLSGGESDTLTSVNTSATTGAVTATIDGTKATYTGGAGVDNVTLATGTALTKAIDLGAGDDTLSFAALAVSGSTAALNGGDGTDTLSMAVATADALDASAQSFYTNFERLTLNTAGAGGETIDLANLGFTNYVRTSGSGGTLTLNNLASNGTVVLTVAPTTGFTVGIKDAATGTADVLNAVLSSAGDLAAGVLTAANVETVNISTVDTEGAPQTRNNDTLTLAADKATTVNVTGGQNLVLTTTNSKAITLIDASTATGNVTATSTNTTAATTIKGGAGNDTLKAATGTTADVLEGGAGNDTLTANAGLSTLTGGAGNDLFVIGVASANVNSYATITDFAAGDVLQITGATTFASAKVTLADTAVFQDYANAAMNALAANGAGWFQHEGNTYVVADFVNSTTFENGTDFIVKLTGLVDLSQASFNATTGTIALV